MENKTNKRAGIGQKPRGRQETRGVEALSVEKPVASNEGQEEGVNEPVSGPADRLQRGGGLLDEISPISHKTEEIEKMPSVAVSEEQSLDEILAQSVLEDGKKWEAGKVVTLPEMMHEDAVKKLELWKQNQVLQSELGEQPDRSFKIAVRLEEGYIEPVRQWAEAEGLSVEEWVARQFSHYLETWGQPAKSR
jgi:predicted HicB family RNase H-like nuclease